MKTNASQFTRVGFQCNPSTPNNNKDRKLIQNSNHKQLRPIKTKGMKENWYNHDKHLCFSPQKKREKKKRCIIILLDLIDSFIPCKIPGKRNYLSLIACCHQNFLFHLLLTLCGCFNKFTKTCFKQPKLKYSNLRENY